MTSEADVHETERFPIQIQLNEHQRGYAEIPMRIALEAYKEYAARYGTSQSLERLGERGGFGIYELAQLLYERIERMGDDDLGS